MRTCLMIGAMLLLLLPCLWSLWWGVRAAIRSARRPCNELDPESEQWILPAICLGIAGPAAILTGLFEIL